jgi:2,4-dienoyl-CoA reductase (NADPH2)
VATRWRLFDSASEIGGQFNIAKQVPGKEEFYETLRYYDRQFKLRGVKLSLNTRVTLMTLQAAGGFDDIVLATGVTPRTPAIEGVDHPKVLGYLDVLRDHKAVGKNVAVIGAGGIGFDVSEYLMHSGTSPSVDAPKFYAEWGIDTSYANVGGLRPPHVEASPRKVHLLQRKESKVGDQLGKTTGWIHRTSLKARRVGMTPVCSTRRLMTPACTSVSATRKVCWPWTTWCCAPARSRNANCWPTCSQRVARCT